MTALSNYQRLEATGLWRETKGHQRREVLVSLGDATLMIFTPGETALSHWSLPAVERLNPGKFPALFGPGPDADEMLELAEAQMVDAIETVRGVLARDRPHPGRLRLFLGAGLTAAIVFAAVLWLPDVLLRQTLVLLPDSKRAQIGRTILAEAAELTGQPCNAASGVQSLAQLSRTLFGAKAPRLVVLPGAVPVSAHMPGNIILIHRSLVENFETPEVLAGYVLAEDLRRQARDPMERLLEASGFWVILRMITTGEIDRQHLHQEAHRTLTQPPGPVADNALVVRFAAAGLSSEPYAYARDSSGETTLGLIEADPLRGQVRPPIMPDNQWVSLQQICSG